MRKNGTAVCAGLVLSWAGFGVQAQAEPSSERFISIYSSGIDGWLADSRDAGMREALRRLIINGLTLPPGTSNDDRMKMDWVMPFILGETSFELDILPPDTPGVPAFVQFASQGVRGFGGESMLRRMQPIAHDFGLQLVGPDPSHPGLTKFETGTSGNMAWAGAEEGTFYLSAPHPPVHDRDSFADAGLPAGTTLLGGLRVNFDALSPMLEKEASVSPAEAAILKSWGLTGQDALRCVFAVGGTDESVHLAGRVENYGKHFGYIIPAGGVTQDQLKRVPRSAACVQCTRLDLATYLSGLIESLTAASSDRDQQMAKQGKAMAEAMLGIDIHADLLAPMGDAFTCYLSEETGGNGVLSAVCMVSLKDASKMADTFGKISAALDRIAAAETSGYVRMLDVDMHGAQRAVSLRFPGIPLPLEPTIAVADGWLVAGLFPQSVAAAIAQFDAKDSILDAVGFQHAGGVKGVGAVQVQYLDERLRAREGYWLAAMIGAAIDNYTRPVHKADQVAPNAVPPFAGLTGDVRSGLCIARMDGTAITVTGNADRSMVAQMSAGLGQLVALAPIVIPVAAVAGVQSYEAAIKAREAAQQAAQVRAVRFAAEQAQHADHRAPSHPADEKRIQRLKTIGTAMHLAHAEDKTIKSLRDLVRSGHITRHELTVPGHDDARYLIVGGGAMKGTDGEHCIVAEPTGLPGARLCVTTTGSVVSVAQ
ncbi:MAG: hypothetical protein MK101_01180 [Phycisphaerales bacterium]|nr:hypothetical protein [Phycisphaerales bacterium]